MTDWSGDIVAATGGGIFFLGLIIFFSGLPKELSGMSEYQIPLSLVLIVIGALTGIYGLGMGSDENRKTRIIEFLFDILDTV